MGSHRRKWGWWLVAAIAVAVAASLLLHRRTAGEPESSSPATEADAPIKSLKGFQRVSVAPGATAKVTVELAPDSFAYYDGEDGLEIKPGKYQILYGNSSADADLKALAFEVK